MGVDVSETGTGWVSRDPYTGANAESMNPRRVLMTADAIGGVWTYALELAAQLGEYGVEVGLAVMGQPLTPEQCHAAAQLPTLTVFESAYKLEWMEQPWADVAAAGDWLLRVADQFRPDVIHLNGYAHGTLNWNVPVLIVAHSCVLSWWRAVKGCDAPPEWDAYRVAVRAGLNAVDQVIAPTWDMLTALETHYGPLPSARVIVNGRSVACFAPRRKEPIIVTAGRAWDEAKNVAALVRVAPRLRWPVYVAGETQHPDGGAVTLPNVHLLGRLPAIVPLLARAAIYAMPARYEPFGLSVLEAALSGCALVLGDIASLRENWEGAALFVPPDDADALYTALEFLIDNADERERLAAAALQRAQSFTPERMAGDYLAAYQTLMNADVHAEKPGHGWTELLRSEHAS